jgi:hypothetical protein
MRTAVLLGAVIAALIVADLVFNDARMARSVQHSFDRFMTRGLD